MAARTITNQPNRKKQSSKRGTLTTRNNERFEKLVYSILPGLTKCLDSKGSEPFNPKAVLDLSIYNMLATICFGKQFEFDGPEINFYVKVRQDSREPVGNGLAADYFPFLRHFPTPAVKKLRQLMGQYFDAVNKELEEHRASYDGGEPKDLIDVIFQVRKELEDEGKEDMTMITDTHIRQTILDIFSGGTETSIFTLHWCIGLLVQHPDVQAKVAAELDKVVGRDRLPCLNDRDNLPYTVATLYEVLRYGSVAPVASPHATTTDVQIGGYTIPKGTWVLFNTYSMHYDEELWDEPHKFKPEHFLDEAGKVRLHPEGFLPFSAGRRVCLGESMAKAQLFLIFSWLFQHFKFAKAPGMEQEDYSEGKALSFMNVVKENDVVVEKRF
ncbi:Steroid 17-alpha-hydroxylase/17,20 lyase [Holothuria leucospilota]|uniref:Steroid 17-alpha-hydroxylase/17,20 lyase n=1 Tax=Holothuria leucospilota TaxID=206669 RepID=A0A9Q0YCI8_HOLLE|nr:Steroid 17-alpha-hydroxylase/17,20 lyase [Holothuria leucospilota]